MQDALDRVHTGVAPGRQGPQAAETEGDALVGAADAAIAREAKPGRKAPKVDALPGPEAVKRVGEPDVQAALETVAAANGGHERAGGVVEADAA